MRRWQVLFAIVLVACGGKLATEPSPSGDDDDDDDDDIVQPPPSSSGYVSSSGYASSGYGTTSGYPPPSSSGYPYPYEDGGYSSSGYSSSGYPYPYPPDPPYPDAGSYQSCADLSRGCSGDAESWKCFIGNLPSLSCSGDFDRKVAECTCFDAGGPRSFKVPIAGFNEKQVIAVWQKYCGGVCY